MGYAYGQLMSDAIKYDVDEMFKYIEGELGGYIIEYVKLPKFLIKMLEKVGISLVKGLLDLNWYIAKPYTPKRYKQEMNGLAKGGKLSYLNIRRLNMFPELT